MLKQVQHDSLFNAFDKSFEGRLAFGIAFINSGVLKNLAENYTGFFLDNINDFFFALALERIIFFLKLIHPVCMFSQSLVCADIFALNYGLSQVFEFCLKAARKHCKAHNFNQTDVFLFDVMKFCMRVIYSKRVLRRCNVIAEN